MEITLGPTVCGSLVPALKAALESAIEAGSGTPLFDGVLIVAAEWLLNPDNAGPALARLRLAEDDPDRLAGILAIGDAGEGYGRVALDDGDGIEVRFTAGFDIYAAEESSDLRDRLAGFLLAAGTATDAGLTYAWEAAAGLQGGPATYLEGPKVLKRSYQLGIRLQRIAA